MKYLIFALCITAAVNAKAQPGALDNSFGNGGIVVGEGYTGYAYATTLQQDGKILAVGGGGYKNVGGAMVVRYNTNGSIDNTFGDEGIVVTDLNGEGEGFTV